MKLRNKVALITGCSPNINAGIGLELAKAGARLVCTDYQLSYAQACADAVVREGGKAIAARADVTNEDDVIGAVRKAEEAFGGVDILVNGATIICRLGVLDMSADQFRKQIDVILAGTFLFTKYAAKSMIERRRPGVVLNIGSTEGHQGNPGNIAYGTAKSGLLNFTRSAAMELAPYGIRVNSITPTATDSAEGRERATAWGVDWQPPSVLPRAELARDGQGIPLGRRPSPSHYGKAAVFLASDDAEMITGFDLRVDGGTIARYWRWNPSGAPAGAAR